LNPLSPSGITFVQNSISVSIIGTTMFHGMATALDHCEDVWNLPSTSSPHQTQTCGATLS
jgi:hypothetical protein